MSPWVLLHPSLLCPVDAVFTGVPLLEEGVAFQLSLLLSTKDLLRTFIAEDDD